MTAGNESRILIGAYHASARTRSLAPSYDATMLDDSSLVDEAYSFIPGHKNSSLTVESMFDSDTTAGEWWSTITSAFALAAGSPVSVAPYGFAAGRAAWIGSSCVSQVGFPSAHDALVMMPVTFTASDIAAWGHALTSLQTITSTTTGTAVDNGAASAAGAVANLHCTAISGSPSFVATVQDSADNSSWSTIGTFSTLSASKGSQRIAISGNVRRYTRAVCTITGGSTPSVTCQVSLARL